MTPNQVKEIVYTLQRSHPRVYEQMQQAIERGDQTLPELGKRAPDLHTICFFLQVGHKTIAIRYYRDCTETSMPQARQAIAQLRNREV